MQDMSIINVELRTSTKKGDNNLLKRNGYSLGNIVGKGEDSIAIAVKKDEFRKAIKKSGRNAVFELAAPDNQKYTVMVKEIHVDPIKRDIEHLDFQVVSLSETIKQDVAIKLTGTKFLESKDILVTSSVDFILVEGFPQDIPDEIEVDVSKMEAGESMQFSDIKLPKGLTSSIDPEQNILTAVHLKSRREDDEDVEEEETE